MGVFIPKSNHLYQLILYHTPVRYQSRWLKRLEQSLADIKSEDMHMDMQRH